MRCRIIKSRARSQMGLSGVRVGNWISSRAAPGIRAKKFSLCVARFFPFHSSRRRRAAPNGSRAFLEVYLREKSSQRARVFASPPICACICVRVSHTELYTADKLIAVPVCTFVKLFHQPFAITNTRR